MIRSERRYASRSRLPDTVKIPSFTGKEDWQVWIASFEAIADRFGWGNEDRLDQLLPRMEGQAAQSYTDSYQGTL
jgi:hypothetical protein